MLKQLVWVGTSLSDLKDFPAEVQDGIGYSLYQAQLGHFPDGAKPMKRLNGVIEIIENFDKNTYRAVYAIKLGSYLYILHAFQKKSKSGIKTPKEEVELIKQRLLKAKAIAKGEL